MALKIVFSRCNELAEPHPAKVFNWVYNARIRPADYVPNKSTVETLM